MPPIYNVTPFTMLDYPGKTACIVWFSGCNMRCGYCHNPEIVEGKGRFSADRVLEFLRKRKGLLDGVVLSGGEPCLFKSIVDFSTQIKSLGYALKLDTNGTRPGIVRKMLDKKLPDYVALDYKAPFPLYKKITATRLFGKFEETLALLCGQDRVPFEVRTTVHRDQLGEQAVAVIMDDLSAHGFKGIYYVQNYTNANNAPTLGSLPVQKLTLDIRKLPQPKGFTLEFRNF
ncbi:MAG: anaerobic ribonucleoside-triphosphate reductase activating protein [Pseudomonadota bacterium]